MNLSRRATELVAAFALTGATAAWAETATQQHSIEAQQLLLRNLIGAIDVSGHDGPTFEVELALRGAQAAEIEVVLERGDEARLTLAFPVDEHRRFVYPELGRGEIHLDLGEQQGASWIGRLFGQGRIEISGTGSGLEAWADVKLRVPRGGRLIVEHGVGNTVARNVVGPLSLGSHSGRINVLGADGALLVDTGSGDVRIEDVRGPSVRIDTGSGSVEVERVTADEVTIDTGSGEVEAQHVTGDELSIDTGSGSVTVLHVDAEELTVDTGSGSVEVQLERMGGGRFRIDTGSGGIELRLPSQASAAISAETGSGSVQLELGDEVQVLSRERDSVELRVGAGEAQVQLDTGSGSIHISR